jgi:hypothetical protein
MSNLKRLPMLVGLAVCCGCSGPEIATGPFFEWSGRSDSQNQGQFPLKFIDQRPEWEHTYRVPATDSAEYEWAVGFIPLENFVPEIPHAMEESVRESLGPVDSRYAFGDLTLHSFRVLVDRRDVLKRQFDREVRRAQKRNAEEIPEPALFPSLRFEGMRRLLVGPPRELGHMGNPYGPGVICEIEVLVGLHRVDDGGREEFRIKAVGTATEWAVSGRTRGGETELVSPAAVDRAVKEALEGFELRVTRALRKQSQLLSR